MYSIQYQDNKVTSSSINTVSGKEKLACFGKLREAVREGLPEEFNNHETTKP